MLASKTTIMANYIYESKSRKTTIIYDKDVGLAYDILKVFQSPLKASSKTTAAAASSNRSSPDNNLCCCSCLELVGGKLYTCSRCTSSFHSICHFPPLPVNAGKIADRSKCWTCHRCQTELALCSADSVPTTSLSIKDPQQREDLANLSIIRSLLNTPEECDQEHEQLSTFASTLKAINAREFSLDGLDVEECFYKLPFDELFGKEEQNKTRETCFYCKKFHERQMLCCDFCPAVFCFNCLNPPVAALKNERFLCPLHVERFVDLYLVNSLRVTERMALWKKHSTLPSRDFRSIYKEFYAKNLREAQEKNLPQREAARNGLKAIKNGRTKGIPEHWQRKTFSVNALVKEAYARAEVDGRSAKDDDDDDGTQIVGDDTKAANILATMRERSQICQPQPLAFFPALLNKHRPIYAALQLISGADKIADPVAGSLLIPIQSTMCCLDFSQFSSCIAVERQQMLIYFDKSKLAFELLSPHFFHADDDEFGESTRTKIMPPFGLNFACKCHNPRDQDHLLNQLDTREGLVPSSRAAVLWNGATIRIGCLRLLFVGLGIL